MNSLKRKETNYLNDSDTFIVKKKNYLKQYNDLYVSRMKLMKDILIKKANRKWNSNKQILDQIIKVEEDKWKDTQCIIIGMIFKPISSRPNIDEDYQHHVAYTSASSASFSLTSKEFHTESIYKNKKLLSTIHDHLVLEDNSGRIILSGTINLIKNELVTGVFGAFLGKIGNNGEFIVTDYTFVNDTKIIDDNENNLDDNNQNNDELNEKNIEELLNRKNSKFLAITSGLLISDTTLLSSSNIIESLTPYHLVHDFSIQLLIEFLAGKFGQSISSELSSRISQLIIAGDSTSPPEFHSSLSTLSSSTTTSKNAIPYISSSLTSLKTFDVYLSQILTSCPVTLLPGLYDVSTNLNLPQQPFHSSCLPIASRFSSFSRVTNPCLLKFDQLELLGHSGQSINDIHRQTFPIKSSYKNKLKNQVDKLISSSNGTDSPASDDSADVDILITGAHIRTEDEGEVDPNMIVMDGETIEVIKTEKKNDTNEEDEIIETNLNEIKKFRLQILQNLLTWGNIAPTAPGNYFILIYFF